MVRPHLFRSVLAGVVIGTTGLVAQSDLHAARSLDGTWQIRPETEADGWRPVTVPAAFETALGTDFDGVARYRRVLPGIERGDARVFVEFDAVATHATVFVNGREVGSHLGGWTPFRVDVTDALREDGDDVLEVVVDERVGHNTQGFLPIVQPHFGGIWQSVRIERVAGPRLDRHEAMLFGELMREGDAAEAALRFVLPVHAGDRDERRVAIDVRDGERVVAATEANVLDRLVGSWHVPATVRGWSPEDPVLYTVRVRLFDGRRECDRIERRIGFRKLAADGTRVDWNGAPLSLRGVLHWGFSPPHLAPPADPAHWRRQLEHFRSLGFNCVKCCLWVPPRGFYELCDELGMLVWQEYPTWHPQMDQAHEQELLTEYGEFFRLDRSHPSVAFRSITCETGQGADLDVVKALFDACKAAVPDTLVVDDSSWIGWQRVTDFWDEHPYGNNSWFPGRLDHFLRHIAEHGRKPLLLGECLAADTWVDGDAWRAAHADSNPWWQPSCWDAQTEAERWLVAQFGQETLDSLQPIALAFGMRNRKFQIEQLRLRIPDAGYVVSVARDIPKCRMGLYDDLDRPKWSAEDWAWHGDTMLILDQPGEARAVAPGQHLRVCVSHRGRTPLVGTLELSTDEVGATRSFDVALQPGETSAPFEYFVDAWPKRTVPMELHGRLNGSHRAQSTWDLWLLGTPPRVAGDAVVEADALTPELLDRLLSGGRVLLHAGDRPGAPRTDAMWFLKGAPFAPSHPAHERVPRDLLLELSSFDLESGRVIPWDGWRDEVDPILAFWETHDIPEVRFWLHAFDTRVGRGRLLVTAMRHDAPGGSGGPVLEQLRSHLADGPAPKRALSEATVAALRQHLSAKTIELPTWRFRTDPDDAGRDRRWSDPATDVAGADWRDLRAGSHWENQGEDLKHYTGVAWYRVDVDVPADWDGLDARAVFDGVDDSFHVWLNGELLGSFGDEATRTTIWLEQQVQELGQKLRPGQRNTLALRVVDHAGAGGLWRPVRLTTGPVGDRSRLLR